MKKYLYLLLGILLLGGSLYFMWDRPSPNAVIVTMGNTSVAVEIRDTPEGRALGLSGRDPLMAGTGMLFVFDEPGMYTFWMKDMKFAIDIIWIGLNRKVVSIKENATPESYPESFAPTEPAMYVIEVPAGFVSQYGIDVGDSVSFDTQILGYPHSPRPKIFIK